MYPGHFLLVDTTYSRSTAWFSFGLNFQNCFSRDLEGWGWGGGACPILSKEEGEVPLGTISYQTSFKRSWPFWLLIWCQKTFVLFCPIREQQTLQSFRVFLHAKYMKFGCSPRLFDLFWLFPELKDSTSEQMQGKRSKYLRLSHR